MRFKKFFIIPALLIIYIFFVNLLFSNIGIQGTIRQYSTSGALTIVSVGEAISIVVTRSYYFGLIRLPSYHNLIGEIGGVHRFFFYRIIPILTGFFILLEIKKNKKVDEIKFEWEG